MKKVIPLVLLGLVWRGVLAGSPLEEANTRFQIGGRPIHPFLIADFTDFFDRRNPAVGKIVALDSIPRDTADNEPLVTIENDWVRADQAEPAAYPDAPVERRFFTYRWLGKLGQDIHVVQTANHTGGSGLFMDLLFIQLTERKSSGSPAADAAAPALLMTLVGSYRLGDRYFGEIELSDDGVRIPASAEQFGGGSLQSDLYIRLDDVTAQGRR